MNNDKELLTLAAKAAGLKLHWGFFEIPEIETADGTYTFWNPLKSDGDALRLAVSLGRIGVDIKIDGCVTSVNGKGCMNFNDANAAARSAIVFAAADIGKAIS